MPNKDDPRKNAMKEKSLSGNADAKATVAGKGTDKGDPTISLAERL